MAFVFTDTDIKHIASVLGVTVKKDESLIRFELSDSGSGRQIALEIQPNLALPPAVSDDQAVNLISVYAASSFLQLQGCTGYIASQELGEVIFFAKQGGVTSGL